MSGSNLKYGHGKSTDSLAIEAPQGSRGLITAVPATTPSISIIPLLVVFACTGPFFLTKKLWYSIALKRRAVKGKDALKKRA
jgi:hypothetical protein